MVVSLPCKARSTEFMDSKMSTKNDGHVRKRSSKNCSYVICLAVASCKNSYIFFRKTKTLFNTFPFESNASAKKRVANSKLRSLHKSTNRRELSAFALMKFNALITLFRTLASSLGVVFTVGT